MLLIRNLVVLLCCVLFVPPVQADTVGCGEFAAAGPAKININSASAEQLSSGLKGVGKAKAAAIVEWRETNGVFKTLDDLDEVKGIGPGLIEKNRDIVVFRDE